MQQQPVVLVTGFVNPNKHQIVRQASKFGANVQHIIGDFGRTRPLPRYDLAIITLGGTSHETKEAVIAKCRAEKKPYLLTHESFSVIKDQFLSEIQKIKEKGMSQSALKPKLIALNNTAAALRYILYYHFKKGEEFYYKDFEKLAEIHYPLALEPSKKNCKLQPWIYAHTQQRLTLMLTDEQDGGMGNRKFVFLHPELRDIFQFMELGLNVHLLSARHPDLVATALEQQAQAHEATENERREAEQQGNIFELSAVQPEEPAAEEPELKYEPTQDAAPAEEPIQPEPPSQELLDELAGVETTESAKKEDEPVVEAMPKNSAVSSDLGPVVADVRATAELLLDRVNSVEMMLRQQASATQEEVELARRARMWLEKIPLLEKATPQELAKIGALAMVMLT